MPGKPVEDLKMDNPRPEKIAVIDEVRGRAEESTASVAAEYRGLTVAEMAQLRRSLRAVGGDFKVFKNTLVKRAISGTAHEPLSDLLTGPTGIAFVQGDVSAVAKALKEFAAANPALVVKGGVLDGAALDAKALKALADLPSREVLLARLAGLIASPMTSLAGLMKAVPQSFAYGLKALIESKPAEAAPAAEAPAAEETSSEVAPEADAVAEEAPQEEAPAAEEVASDDAPVDAAAHDTPAEEAQAEPAADEA